MPSEARYPYRTTSDCLYEFLVKPLESRKSPQPLHSIPEINFAKVSSRSHQICHNRNGIKMGNKNRSEDGHMGVPHSCEATSGEGTSPASDGYPSHHPTDDPIPSDGQIFRPTDKVFVLFERLLHPSPPIGSEENGPVAVSHNSIDIQSENLRHRQVSSFPRF